MKKLLSMLLAMTVMVVGLVGCSSTTETSSSSDVKEEQTVEYTESKVDLEVGYVQVYDFGDVKLHAYKTKDALDDECFLIEGKDELVALEAPCFTNNISEYKDYIASLEKPLNNVLLAYHPAGAAGLNDEAKYIATEGAKAAQQDGGSVKGLVDGFVQSFGDTFDGTIPEVTEVVEPGTIELAGIEFVISEGLDGFDVVIPAINTVFTHMVGADVHNIMPSVAAIEALEAQMQGYVDANYTLILSSHYAPETIEAAKTKVEYAQQMKKLAEENDNAEDFMNAVNAAFPDYAGANYLEMTASGLYQ